MAKKDIKVQWYRGGSDTGHRLSPDAIPMQVDNMSPAEGAYYGGDQPLFKYDGYVNTLHYAFQYQDLLIDTKNVDPKTGQLTRYRIVSDPEFFHHVEMVLDRMVGT